MAKKPITVMGFIDANTMYPDKVLPFILDPYFTPKIKKWFEKMPDKVIHTKVISEILNLYKHDLPTANVYKMVKHEFKYKNGIVVPSNFYELKSFLNFMCKESDFYCFRNFKYSTAENRVGKYSDIIKIRNKFLDKQISENSSRYTNKLNKLADLISERFFEDNYDNLMLNLKSIFYANQQLKLKQSDELTLLLKFYDTPISSTKQLAEFYKDFKKVECNLSQLVQQNLSQAKNSFIESVNVELKKSESENTFIGQNFTMLCHVVKNSIYLKDDNVHSYLKEIKENHYNNISLSLINQDHIKLFNNPKNTEHSLIFGFNKIDDNCLAHVKTYDSFTIEEAGKIDSFSGYVETDVECDILSVSQFIKNSQYYNEVRVKLKGNAKNKDGKLIHKPDYILCFNKPNKMSLDASVNLNLPIKTLDLSKYNDCEKMSDFLDMHKEMAKSKSFR